MKIMPIQKGFKAVNNKNSFKGTTKYLGYDSNHHLIIQNTPSNVGTGLYDDYTSHISYLVPKFADIRNAFDRRKARTGKIYIGDPDEKIDCNKVLKDHDYAVSDMEPNYPNIDKVSAGYFHDDNTRYNEHFQAIIDFHDRREYAAKKFEALYQMKLQKGINPEDSKEKVYYYRWQQTDSFEKRRIAMEALDIYNKANEQKAIKEELGRELTLLHSFQSSTASSIETTNWAINDGNERLQKNKSFIEELQHRESLYAELLKLPEDAINDLQLKWDEGDSKYSMLRLTIFEDEHEMILNSINKLKEFIAAYQKNGTKIEKFIQNEINTKCELIENLKNLAEDIVKKQKEFDISKAKLIPLFDELKAFYKIHKL